MRRIFILGAGWLGAPLAVQLLEAGNSVTASYRNKKPNVSDEIQLISSENILRSLEDNNPECLIITVPPNTETIELLSQLALLNLKTIQQVIYTSSIGIYPKRPGIYRTSSEIDNASPLATMENILQDRFSSKLTILRLGGLIGGQRHPITHISGKSIDSNSTDPICLVHRDDVNRAIKHIIQEEICGVTFNLFFPLSIDKKTYYAHISSSLGIPNPQWNQSEIESRRIIPSASIVGQKGIFLNDPLNFKFENQ